MSEQHCPEHSEHVFRLKNLEENNNKLWDAQNKTNTTVQSILVKIAWISGGGAALNWGVMLALQFFFHKPS